MKRAWLLAALLACCTAGATETVTASDAYVVRMGRTVREQDGLLRFSYPGVLLRVAFTGTRLAMDAQGSGKSLVDVSVDGDDPARAAAAQH